MKQGTSAKGYCPCGPSKRSKSPAPAHLLPVALLNQRTHGCSLNQSLIHFQRLHTHGDRQMDTQTHKHRHTNTHKHTHTHRHTDTHTHTHTDRHTHPQQAQSKGCAREQVRCQGNTNEVCGRASIWAGVGPYAHQRRWCRSPWLWPSPCGGTAQSRTQRLSQMSAAGGHVPAETAHASEAVEAIFFWGGVSSKSARQTKTV